jgi:hypothetical protein
MKVSTKLAVLALAGAALPAAALALVPLRPAPYDTAAYGAKNVSEAEEPYSDRWSLVFIDIDGNEYAMDFNLTAKDCFVAMRAARTPGASCERQRKRMFDAMRA